MIQFFFLVPLLLSLLWWIYLREKGYTVKQGMKGFAYIIGFSAVIIGFLIVMIFVTH